MKVFISWSGERSLQLASALSKHLPDVLQRVETWMSEHHIAAGAQWGEVLAHQLEGCACGILCLTPESLESRWLYFEAGSLAKTLIGSRVIPYRFGLSSTDVPYPLALFQGVEADEAGTFKMVKTLNDLADAPLTEERLGRVFATWWPGLHALIGAIPLQPAGERPQLRSDRALLEEILDLTRGKAFSASHQGYVPYELVWKDIFTIKDHELKRMTVEELQEYDSKLINGMMSLRNLPSYEVTSWMVCGQHPELVLDNLRAIVKAELQQRRERIDSGQGKD